MAGNSLTVTSDSKGTITTNGVTRPYLYYEYDARGIMFTTPTKGFIADSSSLSKTVTKIAKAYDLTTSEAERLKQDVTNALPQNTSRYLLSIAKPSEIASNIPLSFSIQPDSLYRIHIIVSPFEKPYEVEEPEITPVIRHGFTVVELGAYTKL
jgi:hypothetical protein